MLKKYRSLKGLSTNGGVRCRGEFIINKGPVFASSRASGLRRDRPVFAKATASQGEHGESRSLKIIEQGIQSKR
jgi:hypothetical protein